MSVLNSDQLHRATLGIYSSLIDEFNPSLQKLVSLGSSYIQAFRALATTSEAYFSALSKIGEKALHRVSSHSLGEILIQISESQRRLTLELDGVLRWFTMEVIQQLDNNMRQDRAYISDSRKYYEMEVRNKTAAMERQLWRGSNQDGGEYVQFLRRSHGEALKEEERRHRFLAEKHCELIESIASLMNKTGSSLQQKVDTWMKEVSATRETEVGRPPSVSNSIRMSEDDTRKNREEPPLGNIPSRAPSPQGTLSRASGETSAGGVGGSMRAKVAHQPQPSKSTLLPFFKGDMITVLVQQPRKGWLYGRAENTSQQGWFPASYVEPVDDPPRSQSARPILRSTNSLIDQPQTRSLNGALQPSPPPPPPPPLSNTQTEMRPASLTSNKGAEPKSENKISKPPGSRPELFPRGTNPFATVKLRPTTTNDRSAPSFNQQ